MDFHDEKGMYRTCTDKHLSRMTVLSNSCRERQDMKTFAVYRCAFFMVGLSLSCIHARALVLQLFFIVL